MIEKLIFTALVVASTALPLQVDPMVALRCE